MDSFKNNSVVIAIREAPFRGIKAGSKHNEKSVITFPEGCSNALIVDGNLFSFDHAYSSNVSQLELYDSLIRPLVDKVLAGYDCTALAYGQTGTGKSYSMGMSAEQTSEEQMGFLPRCLEDILDRICRDEQTENNPFPKLLFVSFIEIYNEKAYDLLGLDTEKPLASKGQRRFTGGTSMPLRNQLDLQEILLLGTKNRHVRTTNMNKNSSRSHAIVTIHYKQGFHHSRLNFVDLAGSEGLRRTGNEGIARTEGVHINIGLLAINKVMLSMSAGNSLIPYRDTILTTVLQESLTAGAYVTLLACVSPDAADLSETISTLRFASSAKQVKLSPRASQQLQLLQQKLRSVKKPTSRATTQGIRSVLPSSRTIKRPSSSRALAEAHNSFCPRTVTKGPTKLLQRHHSEMGLTPKAKECTRALFDLPGPEATVKRLDFVEQTEPTLEGIDCSLEMTTQSHQVMPTMADFIQLQNQCNALIRLIKEQQAEKRKEQVTPSLLNHSDYNSDLCSIAEEKDTVIQPRCQLFSSSPAERHNENTVEVRISGISPLSISPSPIVKSQKAPPLRRSVRVFSQQLSIAEVSNGRPQRRSMRIASFTQVKPELKTEAPTRVPDESANNNRRNSANMLNVLGNRLTLLKSTGGSQETRLRKHRSELLAMLNTGDVKSLQVLPGVGPKTAMTLVMQRSLVGPFKSWVQVEKLPIWRGGAWARFATANSLNFQK